MEETPSKKIDQASMYSGQMDTSKGDRNIKDKRRQA